MNFNRIAALIAVFLVFIDFICFFIRGKKNGFAKNSAFKEKKYLFKIFGIYFFSAAIIALSFFMEFGKIGDLVFCGCGVLGFELANRQILGIDEK